MATDSADIDSETVCISSKDAVIHLEYTASTLPSLDEVAAANGGGQWTRFVCISDTHAKSYDVPYGDVLLHGGDLTRAGRESEMKATMDWLNSLPHPVKVIIAGNHDLTLDKEWYKTNWKRWHYHGQEDSKAVQELVSGKKAKESRVVYLENEKTTFRVAPDRREWSVYGSPWSPTFHNWAFNYDHGPDAEKLVKTFQSTDILITHGPPHEILDETSGGEKVGCEVLASHLTSGLLRPRLHVFGHIHEAHGAHIHSWESQGRCEPLQVQNDINYPLVLTEADSEDKAKRVDGIRTATEKCRAQASERNENPELQRTAFVNAATYPQGRNVWNDGKKSYHGGPRFRPIVVDLKD